MEYIKRCNICGHIWCYTDQDMKDNAMNSTAAALSSIGSMVNVIGGTRYDAYEQNKMSNRALNKVVDYNKCPNCNSRNIRNITEEDLKKIKAIEEKAKNQFFDNTSREDLINKVKELMEEKDWISAELYLEKMIINKPIKINEKEAEIYLLKLYVDNKASDNTELIDRCIKNKKKLTENENFNNIMKYCSESDKKKIKDLDIEIGKKIDENIEKEKIIKNEKIKKQNKKIIKISVTIIISILAIILIVAIKNMITKSIAINEMKEKIEQANGFEQVMKVCTEEFKYYEDITELKENKLIETFIENANSINGRYSYNGNSEDLYDIPKEITSSIILKIEDKNNIYILPKSLVENGDINKLNQIENLEDYKYKLAMPKMYGNNRSSVAYAWGETELKDGTTKKKHIRIELENVSNGSCIRLEYFGDKENLIYIHGEDNSNNMFKKGTTYYFKKYED